MTVYIDKMNAKFGRMTMCHMMSTDLDELHKMADAIGLKRAWFQNKPGSTPHYDVSLTKKAEAIALGAVECGPKKVVEIIKYFREQNKFVEDRDAVGMLKHIRKGKS